MRMRRRHRAKASEGRVRAAWSRASRVVAEHPRSVAFFLAGLAVCFTVGPILRYCTNHRYFAVRAVEVQGQRRLDAAQVRVWLGMVEGSSIWAASPRELAARLEAHPAIARAEVRRVLPDRLTVIVKEREPKALLRHGSGAFLVDRSGLLIDRGTLGEGDLPIITVAAGGSGASEVAAAVRSEPRLPETRELRQAVAVARLLEDGAAGVPISEIAFVDEAGDAAAPSLVAYTSDGRITIRLGWGEWRAKLAAVRRVLAHAAGQGRGGDAGAAGRGAGGQPSGTLDVRDPTNVVARWASPGAI